MSLKHRASRLGRGALAVLAPLPFAFAITFWGTEVLKLYDWALFVGVPFGLGLAAATIYGWHQPRSFMGCLGAAELSLALFGLSLVGGALEGLICLLMAAPLGGTLTAIGAGVAYILLETAPRKASLSVLLAVLASLPAGMGVEARSSRQAPLFRVESELVVDAPPEVVWRHVVSFPELPPPDEWIFRAGVAYPMEARIEGQGVGALRFCVFSTGAFVEPITAWEEPRRLAFSVRSNPAPMEEWSPYAQIDPPHLEGFLVSEAGEFQLTPLPGGRTRLVGVTWYRHHMWPAGYWRWWSDAIIHRIHLRVLRHVARQAL